MASTDYVPVVHLEQVWPHIEPWIKRAVAKCGDWTVDGIKEAVWAGNMLMWVLSENDNLKAVAVTELTIVPSGKVCTVIACGGTRAGSWKSALSPIEKYAKASGAVAMRIRGRAAWAAIFDDYDLEWVALEKRFSDAR